MSRNFVVFYQLLFENDNSTTANLSDKDFIYFSIFVFTIAVFSISLGLFALYLKKKEKKGKKS